MDEAFSRLSVLDRMVEAVRRVDERLLRATKTLYDYAVPYAVCGEMASKCWIQSFDPSGVRNTPLVEILIRRRDVETAIQAMLHSGFTEVDLSAFHFRRVLIDGLCSSRSGVHLLFAGEPATSGDDILLPDVDESHWHQRGFRLIDLEPLVRMELTRNRRIDKVVVRDLIDVGLIDSTWPAKLPAPLGERLQAILDDPDG
jgi:hypothetical protein